MPVRVRIVSEGDLILIFESDEPSHRIRAGAVHADLAVMIDRHEREGRIDCGIHHADVQFVNGVDRLPVRSGSATQRIDAELQSGAANCVHVHDIPQVLNVRDDEIFLVCGPGPYGERVRHSLHAGVSTSQQLVRPVLDPSRHPGIGRAAIRRAVLEASVLRRIVRRGDHDTIGEVIFASAIVDQDGARNHRRRRHAVLPLDDGLHSVARQDFKRCALRRRRKGVRILTHIERAIRAVSGAVVADRLSHRENVGFSEAASQRGTPVSAGSEPHHLLGIAQVRTALEILALEPCRVDQHLSWRGPAGERRDARARVCLQRTGQGFTPQMPDAYSAMVRSLENFPEPATFRMALRAQACGSA